MKLLFAAHVCRFIYPTPTHPKKKGKKEEEKKRFNFIVIDPGAHKDKAVGKYFLNYQ
jgi:hypothetical protein